MNKTSVHWLPTTMKDFSLLNKLNVVELDQIAKSDKKQVLILRFRTIIRGKSYVCKVPIILIEVCKTKENPTKRDFVVVFNFLDTLKMFDDKGNIILGPKSTQRINEDGTIRYLDKGNQVVGYISID